MNFPASSIAAAGSEAALEASVDMNRTLFAGLVENEEPRVGKGVKAFVLWKD